MISIIRHLTYWVGFFLPICILGQTIKSELSSEIMLNDLDSLIKTIEASHPIPTGYASEKEWSNAIQIAKDSCKPKIRSQLEFALITSRLLQTMKDSHTQVSINGLWNAHLSNGKRIIGLRLIDGKLSKDPLGIIPQGSEIVSLNGMGLADIQSKTASLIIQEKESADGIGWIKDQLFSVYYSVFFLEHQTHISIQYIDLDQSIKSIDYPTWGKKDKDKYQKKNRALYDDLPKFEFHQDTAYIEISSFAPSKMKKQNRIIHRFFKQCEKRKIQELVIDLRDNTGGKSTEVEYLMSYLLEDGYNAPDNIIALRSELSDNRVKTLKKKSVQIFLKLFASKNEDIQRYIDLVKLELGEKDTLYFKNSIQQRKWIYKGNCHLWVNGLSASASVDFTQAFQKYKRGPIWGQCVMGNNQGTFGNAATYVMPHSKIQVSIATIRYNYGKDFGLFHPNICPDHRIEYSTKNIIEGTDPYWSAFRKKI